MGNGMQDGMGWGQGAAGRWNDQGNMNYNGVGNGGGYYSASSTSGGYSHQQFHENQFTAQQYHEHFQDGRSRQPFIPGGNHRGSIGSAASTGVGEGIGAVATASDVGQQFIHDSQNQQKPQDNAPTHIQEQSSDVPGSEGSVEPQTNGPTAHAAAESVVTAVRTDDEAGRALNGDTTVPTTELPINNVPPSSITANGNEFYHQNYMMNYPMDQYSGVNPGMNSGMNPALNNYGGYRGNFNGGFRGGRGGHWSGMNGISPVAEKPPGQGLGVEGAPTGPKALREGFRGGRVGIRGGFGARGGIRGGYAGSAWSRRFANHLAHILLYIYFNTH